MICIVRIVNGEITGWIIATDTQDARRQLQGSGNMELAERMYRMDFVPRGKHDLGNGYTMLVS